LRSHTQDNVVRYFTEAGRDSQMSGRLFRQIVHAVQLLFLQLLKAHWATEFDWEYWLSSAQALESTHPTLARHNSPIASIAPPPPLAAKSETDPSQWRNKLIAEIRRRNYSIRTEEAYVGWAARFMRFCNCDAAERLNQEHVAAYLNYLALAHKCAALRSVYRAISPKVRRDDQRMNFGNSYQLHVGHSANWIRN
jgi:hypothetical protein